MDSRLEDLISRVRTAIEGAKTPKDADRLHSGVAALLEDQNLLNIKELVASSCLAKKCKEALAKAGAPKAMLDKDIEAAVVKALTCSQV